MTLIPLRRIAGRSEEMSDAALVAACGAGDSAALGALFDRYHEAVYRFLTRMARTDAEELDDLVQTTFIEVSRSASRFRRDAAVKTWILGISANVARHYARAEVRRKSAFLRFGAVPLEPQDGPEALVERGQRRARVQSAVHGLPYPLRVVVVLCDLEEIKGADAARTLGIPEGTLWRRLHEARKALRAALEAP